MAIKTYYIIHTITLTQEIPARSKKGALKIYESFLKDQPGDFVELIKESGATSTSSTDWEIEVLDPNEMDERDYN